ncbi:TVP38/TMEM64 family protein [Bacillus paralicheniformis]|uniref:TVP38/TMEM64 family protein n=1 Tax=Bacillus TaxID=1386 RepID=UPI0003FCBF74|nr:MULTISPECIES: TVP38/TMEM64 family protein [Bacillus]ARA85716.1 TVP38/TMEM64 family protein [Bacillus paralicheniformis]MCD2369319.1 TVP38/TMEM64 family protein [Bacillus sp. BS3(2021)]MCJ8230712.1 TVP38/TMEM64 family protein [Bacillus paralicheniformis]MCQ5455241.1 TVP38/TMEM64 family protein [Bacillus paralicheniformis]MED1066986.1 TVP38/TMEM64 family protein [Bacillus paralicheniformis]
MIRKLFTIIIMASIIAVGFVCKDSWLGVIRDGGIYSVLFSMLLVAACVFFPIVPFALIAGLNGALFGIANGVLITLTGSMLGTMLLFFLSRYGFRDLARKRLTKYPKMSEYEAYFNQNAFTAVLLGRLIPVIPAVVMNIVCGLSKVKWAVFFAASTLGKIPNVLVVSIAGANFSENKLISIGVYGLYMAIIALVIYRKYPHLTQKHKETKQTGKPS